MSESLPPIVCVIGLKDSGKTSTAVALTGELVRRGLRVFTVKHGHRFEIDTEGTDSWRLRHEAGPEDLAVMGRWGREGEPGLEELVRRFAAGADIVVVEGFKSERMPKIEVFRTDAHPEPLYGSGRVADEDYLAVVTDAELALEVPVIPLGAPELAGLLADLVEERLLA